MEDTLLGEKTVAFSIAQEILNNKVVIPAFPANGRQILAVVRQPKDQIDIPGFVKLIESDPGMFVRMLKLANSSYYGGVEKVVSLRAAITRVGLIETVNTVCLHFFQKFLPKFPDILGFSYNKFWSHSWAVAVANRRLGHPNLDMGVLPGELYMAGMLQGIGKLMLAIHYPKEFSRCLEMARRLSCPLEQAERDVFGTTDSLVASKVLTVWELPPNICQAVAFCQQPESATPEHIILAGLTQFAYAVVDQSEVGFSGDGCRFELSETYFAQRPQLKIAQPRIQDALVKEITTVVREKSGTVTMTGSKTAKQPNQKPSSTNSSKKEPSQDKGIMGWVKSLWE